MPRGVPNKKVGTQEVSEEFDPFGDSNTPDEAQAEVTTPPWDPAHEAIDTETDADKNVKVVNVGNAVDDVVTGTIKGGRDFDEPWIVIRAGSLQEYIDIVTDRELLGQAMDATQQASKAFRDFRPTEDTGTRSASPQNGSQGQEQRSQGRPPAATEGPWGVQTCPHGTMTFKSGVGVDGQVWQGYFCPVPKGQTPRCAKNKYVR